jgi:hypothetical protein
MGWRCFGKWGGHTGVAGVCFFRAFDEASDAACLRGLFLSAGGKGEKG